MTLESLLNETKPIAHGIARHYRRIGWGIYTLDHDDYLQEASLAAIMVFREHSRFPRRRLIPMVRRATLFRVRRIWQKELSKVYWQLPLESAIELQDYSSCDQSQFKLILTEAERIVSGIYRELLIALMLPEPDDLTMIICFEMFKTWPKEAIQQAEFAYLASYFSMTKRKIQRLFYDLREQLNPLLLQGAS